MMDNVKRIKNQTNVEFFEHGRCKTFSLYISWPRISVYAELQGVTMRRDSYRLLSLARIRIKASVAMDTPRAMCDSYIPRESNERGRAKGSIGVEKERKGKARVRKKKMRETTKR